ncbi:hypothetical protein [Halorussus halobius]|uniref:hypothetical protein n=1 Tax=Halorussus halobius TaxID=1710537 RepID=UPI001092AE7B|nr:hypothetical protein [Halorussus halobius]
MYGSTDTATPRSDSPRTDSTDAIERPRDERELYGQPCHEVDPDCDERALYGDPQHEPADRSDVPDVELLFVRLRAASVTRPAETPTGASPSSASSLDAKPPVGTTER